MENLGKYFLDLRLQQGYSYQDIWKELRFPENQIKAIEENHFAEPDNHAGIDSDYHQRSVLHAILLHDFLLLC